MENSRYSLIDIFTPCTWQHGCPIEVLEGALIFDNLVGQHCIQLSLAANADLSISTVHVDVSCYDVNNTFLLGEPVNLVYKNIEAERNVPFGLDETFYLRSGRVASVRCAISQVVLRDGTSWHADQRAIEVRPKPYDSLEAPLREVFEDNLQNSYYADTQCDFSYLPRQEKQFWLCACGHCNDNEQTTCARCDMNRAWLLANLSRETLARVLAEREAAQRAKLAPPVEETEEPQTRPDPVAPPVDEPVTMPVAEPESEPVTMPAAEPDDFEEEPKTQPGADAAEPAVTEKHDDTSLMEEKSVQIPVADPDEVDEPAAQENPILRYAAYGLLGLLILVFIVAVYFLITLLLQ